MLAQHRRLCGKLWLLWVRRMTPSELKSARKSLGLTTAQPGAMLDTDAQTIRRMEQRGDANTFRSPAPRMLRLLRAYLDGYRPADWPVKLKEGC